MRRNNTCVLSTVLLFLSVVVLLYIALMPMSYRGKDAIACVTCPCGTQYLAPYATCRNCGKSSMEATYCLKYKCINCGEMSAGHAKCPKCGLVISEAKRSGCVKDLPMILRKEFN